MNEAEAELAKELEEARRRGGSMERQ